MAVGESEEVKREGWLRGDWWALREKLPSTAWLRSKLPHSASEWYLWAIIAVAGSELLWSTYLKFSERKGKES